MAVDRLHQLAQAAQVGDLLAERVTQHLECVERLRQLPLFSPPWFQEVARMRMCEENLARSVDAYRSVRT